MEAQTGAKGPAGPFAPVSFFGASTPAVESDPPFFPQIPKKIRVHRLFNNPPPAKIVPLVDN
jgi:hypothetical protein